MPSGPVCRDSAVCPPLVRAVAAQLLAALATAEGATAEAAAPPAAPSAAAPVAAPPPPPGCGSAAGGCTGGERCEAFLSVAAINLLRGVTPPCEGPDAAGADYGRYGAETPAERYARVLSRPADKLFCMECVRAYALSPAGVAPAPANVPS